MKLLVNLFCAVALWGANGVYSDMTVSQQGVGFRASVTVFLANTATKATLFRDQPGVMGLGNPFQSNTNGRFTFYTANGWYDLTVSGAGVTTYSYRVFITDGTFTVGGQAGGDLSGQYPDPSVGGIGGKLLTTDLLTNDVVPSFSQSQNKWLWRVPLYSFPTGLTDVTGTYPNLTVTGFRGRQINNTSPPNEGDTLRFRSVEGKWRYEAFATSPTSMTFNLCTASPCVVGNGAAPAYIVTAAVSVPRCWITAQTPPQGQNLIIDVVKLGGASIYPSGLSNKLNLAPAGGIASAAPPAPSTATAGTGYSVNILQVGSGVAGQNVTVACQLVGN